MYSIKLLTSSGVGDGGGGVAQKMRAVGVGSGAESRLMQYNHLHCGTELGLERGWGRSRSGCRT